MVSTKGRKKICVIGLGNMGSALAEALLCAGYEVIVWNRTSSKREPLISKGATAGSSMVASARAADVTLVCVSNHAATTDLIFTAEVGRALEGKLLIQLSTISQGQSRETAEWARARDITYLEGSIIGFPSDVTSGSAIIIYAGPRESFDRNFPILSALGGSPRYLSAEIGAAVTFDKAIFAFAYGTMLSFIQGAAIAYAKKFPIEIYTDTIAARLPTYPRKFKLLGDMIAKRNYDDVGASLQVHAEAFGDSLNLCKAAGIDDRLLVAVMRNLERAIEAGYGEKEISAVFEVLIRGNA